MGYQRISDCNQFFAECVDVGGRRRAARVDTNNTWLIITGIDITSPIYYLS